MAAVRSRLPVVLAPIVIVGVLGLIVYAASGATAGDEKPAIAFLLVAVGLPAAYVVTRFEPAYSMTAVIILSAFASNWDAFGIPGPLAPNRILLVVTILAVVFRVGASKDRPKFKLGLAHLAVLGTAVYAFTSAFQVDQLLNNSPSFFALLEAYGLLPFLTFLVAPIVFRTREQRNILITGLLAFGLYLSITAVLERAGLYQFVFPRYIADPNVGIHFGNARGPFVQATLNGFALYCCAVAGAVGAATWRRPNARLLAGSIAAFCLVATVLTFQRNVWIGVVIGTLVALYFARGKFRGAGPVLAGLGAGAGVLFFTVPALFAPLVNQANDTSTVYERINADRAAINMIEAKPLFGFGWNRWEADNAFYFELGATTPYSEQVSKLQLHSGLLSNAVELGLVGLAIFALAIALSLGAAIGRRAPPGDLAYWRTGLTGVAAFWLLTMNFVPTNRFATLLAWLFIGILWARYYEGSYEPEPEPDEEPETVEQPTWYDRLIPGALRPQPRYGATAGPGVSRASGRRRL